MEARRDEQPFDRANHCRQIAGLGGDETVRRYGRAHMKALGTAGFAVTCERYHGGRRAEARAALMTRKPLSFSGNGRARVRPTPIAEIAEARQFVAAA